MSSNKANGKKRGAVAPQRSHGKARVAALLEAGNAVIAQKGYDAATMAEIAARAKAPIGSLYRFFPSKEILAGALIQRFAVLINETFDALENKVSKGTVDVIADDILDLMIKVPNETKAMFALLEARSEWSVKRTEFHGLVLKRIAAILRRLAPAMPVGEARNAAEILLSNLKTLKAMEFGQHGVTSPGAVNELRHMNRLYLASKLGKKLA